MEVVEYRSRACQEVVAAEVGVEGPPYQASAVAEEYQRGIREHLGAAAVEGGSQRDHQGQREGQEGQEDQEDQEDQEGQRGSQARQKAAEEEEGELLQRERRSPGVPHPQIWERWTQSRP